MALDLDARLTLTQAAAYAHVSKQLVRAWTLRKDKPLPRADDGTIRLGDLIEVERATRTSGQSHRKQLQAAA